MAIIQTEGRLNAIQQAWWPQNRRAITLPTNLASDYASLYRTQPNVRICVGFLARNLAQLGLHLYERTSNTDRSRLFDHPVAQLIRRPNPWTTRYRFFDALMSDLGVYDNWFGLKVKRSDGRLSLVRIPPYLIQVAPGSSWIRPDAYRITGNKDVVDLPADQFIHLRGYNPEDARVGLSPLETLRRILAEEDAAGDYRESFWENAARMEGVLERPVEAPDWSDSARKRFRAEWQEMYSGTGGSGLTAVLEEGMTWKPASFSAREAQYLEARKLTREECAAAYYIPPPMVGILDHATFSNITEQHKMLYQDTLGPPLQMIQEDFELQLTDEFPELKDGTVYLEFNMAEKLRGSFEERAASIQTSVGAPYLTRNEARALDNRPALPGGDELVTPLNVLIGGQASPTDADGTMPKRRSMKAAPAASGALLRRYRDGLGGFFDQQARSIRSRLGASGLISWDTTRWNRDLKHLLFGLGELTVEMYGQPVADQFDGDWQVANAHSWLDEHSRIAAENINAATYDELRTRLGHSETRKGRKQDDDTFDDFEPAVAPDEDAGNIVGELFAGFVAARTLGIAQTLLTAIGNFGRHDAAEASGVRSKQWVVTSTKSRHPELNGETVPLGEAFSNGAAWPGDSSLPIDQTAGCTCLIDFDV